MDSIVNKLEKDRPLFHDDGEGGFISWNSNTNLLRILEEHLEPGMRTIEIGSGYSTVVFLYKQCFHTCITPILMEVNRIQDYCKNVDISLNRAEFIIEQSYNVLPALSKKDCDLIFIDGAHRFPFPIVDWFYCAMFLKEGGLIVIDDTDIISCHILLKFMLNDPHWEKVQVKENFAFFKKKGGHDYPFDWPGQPFSKNKINSSKDLLRVFNPKECYVKYNKAHEETEKIKSYEKKEIALNSVNSILRSVKNQLPLSVIICTYNRAVFLKMALESLMRQTLDKERYEVIIIDDGSSDNTREIAESFYSVLPLKYFYQNNAGLASAKNHGTYASQGEILLFLDDDDIAAPTLLDEHIKTHWEYPQENYAVLHYTTWAPDLFVTPLMNFVAEVGCFLFSYPGIKHGDILDYTYFWGGRSSCKRSFLIEHGVFNPVFRFGCEDIELGFRLSQYGLKVAYNAKAVSKMVRPIAFGDFCQRLLKQGRSQFIFSSLHNNRFVHNWAEIIGAEEKWNNIRKYFEAKVRSAKELDKIATTKMKQKLEIDNLTKRLLYSSYWWAFKACKIKGIIEAKEEAQQNNNYQNVDLAIQRDFKKDAQNITNLKGDNKFCTRTVRLKIDTTVVSYYDDYKEYLSHMESEYSKRECFEKSFIKTSKPFLVESYCYVCKQKVQMSVDYAYSYKKNGVLTPNWREHMVCPLCGLSNRMRASIHLFEQILQPSKQSRIYILEQNTPLYDWFIKNYSYVVGSEYLDKTIPLGGMNAKGIRNESITELSFPDNKFDFILSFDVFEHVPNFQKAFNECYRVLKQNGRLFFTVPFEVNSKENIIRAVKNDNNKIEYLLPPEYHGDPLSPEGCLAFYCFGWEMLEQLKVAGFTHANAHLYWSQEFGYLGGEQKVFVAEKDKSKSRIGT